MKNTIITILLLFCFSCAEELKQVSLNEYQNFHMVTLSFEGPETSESAEENPFLNYRLTVEFKNDDSQYSIRGFYAADGNAAQTSATSGNIWQVRFTPDKIGEWSYSAELRQGNSIALSEDMNEGRIVETTNSEGKFVVIPSDKMGNDFRSKGRLLNDKGYFKFKESGKYWMKGGADSPENFLAYEDFDGTYRMQASTEDGEAHTNDTIHSYSPHLKDWQEDDPIWKDGKGKGIIGALNYLASKDMNVVYFLTNNINGDGKDVWPYNNPEDFSRFDVSKLDQWEIVFQHMQSKGILLHMVLQETENETMLDGGDTGPMRQLYLHEMISRFGHHLALKFNLGEENGYAEFSPISQNDQQRRSMTNFIRKIDPYDHPILLHTHSHEPHRTNVLDSIVGFKQLDGLSLQVDKREGVAAVMETWKSKARDAGHEWMITMDEIGMWHTGARSDSLDGNHDSLRRYVLWGSLLSGAAGVEWYFGANNRYNDLNTEDWRSRNRLWEITDHALDFFQEHLPYWEMRPKHSLVNSKEAYCLYKANEVYAAYLPNKDKYTIDLSESSGQFMLQWFDPLEGGGLQVGSKPTLAGGEIQDLGHPPQSKLREGGQDWVIVVRRKGPQ